MRPQISWVMTRVMRKYSHAVLGLLACSPRSSLTKVENVDMEPLKPVAYPRAQLLIGVADVVMKASHMDATTLGSIVNHLTPGQSLLYRLR